MKNNLANEKHFQVTKTDLREFVAYFQKFPDQRTIRENFMTFIKRRGLHVNYLKITAFIFLYFGTLSFDMIPKLPLIIETRSANLFDFGCCIWNLIHQFEQQSFIEENFERWVMKLLISQDEKTRIIGQYLVVDSILHISFQKDLLPSPAQKFITHQPTINFLDNLDEESQEKAALFLITLLERIDLVIEQITIERLRGYQFIKIISKLAQISGDSIIPELECIAREIKSQVFNLDEMSLLLLSIFDELKMTVTPQLIE